VTDPVPRDGRLARPRASEQIFADLQGRILSGELGRGDRLPTERDLAASYGVSVNTVRESIRALSLMGLVDVRHGMGAFVTAAPTALVGRSLGMLLRFESTGLLDVVRLAGVLHRYAAARAVDLAEDVDVEEFARAVAAIATQSDGSADLLGHAVERFLTTFVACAHDPLLAALSATLDRVVVTVTARVVDAQPGDLPTRIAALGPVREAMLAALRARDARALDAATADYHARAAAIVSEHPALAAIRLSDPLWAPLLGGLVSASP
jgi:GntR family transcriptional repressor for pyruvate dehydrogenase complex